MKGTHRRAGPAFWNFLTPGSLHSPWSLLQDALPTLTSPGNREDNMGWDVLAQGKPFRGASRSSVEHGFCGASPAPQGQEPSGHVNITPTDHKCQT